MHASLVSVIDLASLTSVELLTSHTQIADELRKRGILRSSNNPTGDLAEYLFCKAFHWKQHNNSKCNVDATGEDGLRYQIKGRRPTRYNNSRQISAIRDIHGEHFDFLAGVIFSEEYLVERAAIIPHGVVRARAVFVVRSNSYKFFLSDDVWDAPDVRDVTTELRAVTL